MHSALRLKRYECWDQSITYNEDIPIARTQADEEEYPVSLGEAESIFLEALDDTLALLELAEPGKGTTPTITTNTGGKRGPKPIDEKVVSYVDRIVKRLAPDGHWRTKADEIGDALNHGFCDAADPESCDALDHPKVPLPRGWQSKRATWGRPPDHAALIKAVEERLKKARLNPPSETPS